MEWHNAVQALAPYVVRIATPIGSGTGWLVSRSTTTSLCGIATAAHVINHAHYWEEPIRLTQAKSGESVLLHESERSILLDPSLDSAAIVFSQSELSFPDATPSLINKDKFVKPGVEVGWLGFPAIPHANICFFSGRISSYLEESSAYLVDGVAINGVSGGPAFRLKKDSPIVMGIVSAYMPNRATGEVLPGVAVIMEATHFHDLAERFRSLDEAKSEETPAKGLPPEPPASGESSARNPRGEV